LAVKMQRKCCTHPNKRRMRGSNRCTQKPMATLLQENRDNVAISGASIRPSTLSGTESNAYSMELPCLFITRDLSLVSLRQLLLRKQWRIRKQ
jgi:hypothetical protein